MMAPHYLQAILIKMATDEAVDRFLTIPPEPIEKVEVIGRTVVVTAGNKCVTMSYSMSGPRYASGDWTWNFTNHEVRPLTLIERLVRLMRRRKRS
jgi:hypothetical protein